MASPDPVPGAGSCSCARDGNHHRRRVESRGQCLLRAVQPRSSPGSHRVRLEPPAIAGRAAAPAVRRSLARARRPRICRQPHVGCVHGDRRAATLALACRPRRPDAGPACPDASLRRPPAHRHLRRERDERGAVPVFPDRRRPMVQQMAGESIRQGAGDHGHGSRVRLFHEI